jgi:hypothetical protein
VSVAAKGIEAMQWNTVSSGVDYFSVTPGASGAPGLITLAAAGSDTNIGIELAPKADGSVKIIQTAPGSGVPCCQTTLILQNLNSTGYTDIDMYDDTSTKQAEFAVGGSGSGLNYFYLQQFGNNPMAFYTNSNERMRILGGGGVAIGTTSATASTLLTVAGGISQTTAESCSGGVTTNSAGLFNGCVASDQRLKTILGAFDEDALSIIRRISPVVYRWKDKDRDDQEHIGFIAQDVQRSIPDAVIPAGKGLLGVDPNAMSALTFRGIQQLQTEITALHPGAFPFHKCFFGLLVCAN